MATFAVTGTVVPINFDDPFFSTRIGNDTYNFTNNASMVVDTDTRYCKNSNVSGSFGAINLNSALSGTCQLLIDGTKVRIIPYVSGVGNVPAVGTVLSSSDGAVTSSFLGVWPAFNVPPQTAGTTISASGYIKVKNVNTAFAAEMKLIGCAATASGPDTVGWIEVVGVETGLATVYSPNIFKITGSWFEHSTLVTTGISSSVYQLPASLDNTYYPGVWVETAASSGLYEFYPNAGGMIGTSSIGNDAIRGKVAWCSSSGSVYLGFDGTNNTNNGYLPGAGRKIRVPNVITVNAAVGVSGANIIPNATIGSRFEFLTTNQGRIDINGANMAWYCNFASPHSLSIKNTGILDGLNANKIHTKLTMSNVGIAPTAYTRSEIPFNVNYCANGADITDLVSVKGTTVANTFVTTMIGCRDFTFNNLRTFALTVRPLATHYGFYVSDMWNLKLYNPTFGVGNNNFSVVRGLILSSSIFYDIPVGTTTPAGPIGVFPLSYCSDVLIDGLSFGGLTLVQPYGSLVSLNNYDEHNIIIRNIGTPTVPLDLGGPKVKDAPWTHTTLSLIAAITSSNHGLITGNTIFVDVSTDPLVITANAARTITLVDANTFTIVSLGGVATTGTVTYWPVMTPYTIITNAGTTMNHDITVQQCYFEHARTGGHPITANDVYNMRLENVWSDTNVVLGPALFPQHDSTQRGIKARPTLVGQAASYGNHFVDYHYAGLASSSTGTWSRVTTVATLTSSNHNKITSDWILITTSSDRSALAPGIRGTSTAIDSSRLSVTCTNAGSATGTFGWEDISTLFAIQMNEPSMPASGVLGTTGSQVNTYPQSTSGAVSWSGAGSLGLTPSGSTVIWEMPDYILGYTGIPDTVAISSPVGTLTSPNFDLFYQIDKNVGTGWSEWRNLHYNRASGTGISASFALTMSSTAGVNVGDSIYCVADADVIYGTYVTAVSSSTIVLTNNRNLNTVAGALIFNQLPRETIDPAVGFKLKIKMSAIVAAAPVTTYIAVWLQSTNASRALQYPANGVVTKNTLWNPSVGDIVWVTPSGSVTTYKANIINSKFPVQDPVTSSLSRYEFEVIYDTTSESPSDNPWQQRWTTVNGYIPTFSALPIVSSSAGHPSSGSITRY